MRSLMIHATSAAIVAAALAAPAYAQSQFNGTWTVSRANSNTEGCGTGGSVFRITVRNGAVTAPGGSGSVSAAGAIRFPGVANVFTGTLNGNSGSGHYSGRCSGVFSARRN